MNRKFANTKSADSEAMVLTVPQAARLLQISPLRAYQLAQKGEIPCVRFGRSVRVPRQLLEQRIRDGGIAK